jgi:hypothetical protein
MKTKLLIVAGLAITAVAAIFWAKQRPAPVVDSPQSIARATPIPPISHATAHPNAAQTAAKRVPAFYETPPSTLPPTLAPEEFIGKTREAYKAVREIPNTIAQLPCYCHCDEAHGHKSLHSCYEDAHAGSCAVCVDEVLLAYRLEKQGLSAPQIRKLIIEKYSADN